MNVREIAWVAGLYEGEGSCVKTGKARTAFRLSMGSTDLDVLQRLASLAGGKIWGPIKKREPHHKDQWHWQLTGAAARGLAMTMLPFLCERRAAKIIESL